MITPAQKPTADGLVMEALLHSLRGLTPLAQGLCVVLLALYLFSGLRFVGPQESALVLRLGQLQPEIHGPGLLLAFPAPLDEIVLVPTGSEQTLVLDAWSPLGPRLEQGRHFREANAAELASGVYTRGNQILPVEVAPVGDSLDPVTDGYTLTGDWNIVQGRFTLRYRITDPVAHFRSAQSPPLLLEALATRALAAELSRQPIDRGLTDGRAALADAVRAQVAIAAQTLRLGISPTAFELRELRPPTQVVAAFEEVTSARLQSRTLAENAREYRERQLGAIRGAVETVRRRADSWARETVAASEGEAAAFQLLLTEYRRTPELITQRLYSESIGQVMRQAHSSTVLPPGENPPALLIEPNTDAPR
ncbi:MAG: protease modulator HflK [Burkholderiales bacterium]|nr:protease modulator HflK [Opitutaceae bacterium]